MTDPLLLFEQQVAITGEGKPDNEHPLYYVPPGQSSSGPVPDRKTNTTKAEIIVGGIAVLALAVAIYAAVKKK